MICFILKILIQTIAVGNDLTIVLPLYPLLNPPRFGILESELQTRRGTE